ncbi:hypothetical protein KCU85_g93, partial [Aureobasidium melanogenum]
MDKEVDRMIGEITKVVFFHDGQVLEFGFQLLRLQVALVGCGSGRSSNTLIGVDKVIINILIWSDQNGNNGTHKLSFGKAKCVFASRRVDFGVVGILVGMALMVVSSRLGL